jgi:TolB-like protein/DNA-binding winged helix-turn-helix (wHTH) protein/Tfp pilus assembly protein PilF
VSPPDVSTFQVESRLSTVVNSRERVLFGDYEFDCRTGELRRNGSTIKIPPQPSKVLSILVGRAGEIVTREELAEQVWGSHTYVDFEHGLNFAIRQIRLVLDDDASAPRYLETVPKRGYRFVAAIRERAQPKAEGFATRFRRNIFRRLLVASFALVVVSLVLFAAMRLWPRKRGVNQKIDSVAVLPLRNLSSDPEQEYFSEGMTDELIADLAKVAGLRVISHTSVERYRDAKRTLPEIARELGVAAIVEGTVMRSGDRVRITAQLIDARSDQHVWADSYERDFRDLLGLQDEVSRKIATEIGSTLGGSDKVSSAKRTVDPAAYDAYLKASFYVDHMTCKSFEQALGYFQSAVAKDPNFAPAQAGLADIYFNLGDFPCWQTAPYDEAEAAALKAVALDPQNADAHAVLAKVAFSRDWNWPKARQEFSMAVQSDPNDAGIHSAYGVFLVCMGEEEQGLAEERKAQELDPFSEKTNFWHTVTLYLTRHYDEMIEHAKHALTFFPSYGEDYWLGEAYEKKACQTKR